MATNLTFGSLFAGVGGIDLGMEAAGWNCKWQVEWDPNCQEVLKHHWPNVPKWLDVCDVNGAELEPVDVITFGSPCQDLSVAGKRRGLTEGTRSNLFFEATRIIREMQNATNGAFPKWAVWENVAGALSSRGGDDFEAVLTEMVGLGAYICEWSLLDAQFFGVPQRRRRVFLVCCFDSAIAARSPEKVLTVREGSRRNSAKVKSSRKDNTRQAEDGIGSDCEEVGVAPTLFSHTQGLDIQASTVASPTIRSNGNGMSVAYRLLSYGHYTDDDTSSTLAARDYKSATDLVVTDVQPYTTSSHAKYVEGVGTLRANGGDIGGGSETIIVQPIAIDGRRNDDVRIDDSGIMRTLEARMGTGGNNVPVIGTEHGVIQYDGYNQKIHEDGVAMTVRIGRDSSDCIAIPENQTMVVRRLTPVECERLMGWPDNHTLHRADGKLSSDTVRYKQCGNGVASPVAKWVAERINDCYPSTPL
jgi:DNA (cytosine-5)-methyltransferase 1